MNPQIKSALQIVPKYIVFLVSLAGTLGSLYFSELYITENGTQGLPPCSLCWYQRIFLYPMVFIMLVGVFRKDTKVYLYTLPLAIIGTIIGAYHYLLQTTDIFGKEFVGCSGGVNCTDIDFQLFGFITIPLMSLAAFVVVLICNIIMHKFGVKYE
jgi:disulfide bond formation protein DsbB